MLHSAIHSARPDLKAIIHIHHPPCVAVSAMKCGLLPVSQEAAIVGEVSYHDYNGLLVDPADRDSIARSLGIHNKVSRCHHSSQTLAPKQQEIRVKRCRLSHSSNSHSQ